MLLQLPSELLLDILGFLDPASFYQCLLSCKIILSHARGSKKLLRQQIDNVPGPKSWEIAGILPNMPAKELFSLFTQRARANLLHGAADVTQLKLPLERFKLGALQKCSCPKNPTVYMALVNTKTGAIGIHLIGIQGKPFLTCIISPHHLNLDRHEEIRFEVLKCAFAECRGGCFEKIAVLYSYRLSGTSDGTFVKQAQQQSKLFTKLVVWRMWGDDFKVEPETIEDVYVGDGREPAALAANIQGTPVVAFSSPERALGLSVRDGWEFPTWEAEQYSARFTDIMAPSSIVARTGKDEGLLTPSEILTKGNRALFSFPLAPTPQWEMDDFLRPNTLVSNFDNFEALANSGITRRDCSGLILASRHQCGRGADSFHVNEVLQLHFQAHGKLAGAYIIKAVEIMDECDPYTPTFRYPNLQSKIVAQLDGINMLASRTSSLGLVLAVSPNSRRIAVASWDRVQVWTLDPMAFFMVVKGHTGIEKTTLSEVKRLSNATGTRWRDADGDTSMDTTDSDDSTLDSSESDDLTVSTNSTVSTVSTDSSESDTSDSDDSMSLSSAGEPDESDWLRHCGWDYFSCHERKRLADERQDPLAPYNEIVTLQPVSLPRCGVVHSLEFTRDDALWGWTDRGPVCWALGGETCGRRRTEFMSFSHHHVSNRTDFSHSYSNTSSKPF
ncbi:hypothetical protein IWZ03DRAFT_221449 [Phyllosticta citriasiana]|uniref:F-box domain-containing protein n=1 Tax=Phyllosticta citriasiana TaxID=595635 RepID=A0ABR1KGT3_9PEZI